MSSHPVPFLRTAALCLLAGLVLGLQGCGPREATPPPTAAAPATPPAGAPPESVPPAAPASPKPAQVAAPVAAPSAPKAAPGTGGVVVKAAPAPVSPATPVPAPEVKPAAPVAAPLQASSPVSDPGGEVAVKPTKAGLSRVGLATCRMCHKVQAASWSESAHAKRNPPLDCESCHGPGSEYKAIGVMKDPAKALAAGLVRPGAAFCATCHKRNWNDGMLKKAHAHKP